MAKCFVVSGNAVELSDTTKHKGKVIVPIITHFQVPYQSFQI